MEHVLIARGIGQFKKYFGLFVTIFFFCHSEHKQIILGKREREKKNNVEIKSVKNYYIYKNLINY